MGLEVIENNVTYLTVVQGTLSQQVKEGTPKSEKRVYEKKDGSTGEKWELKYKSVSGIITGMKIKDSDFGEQLIIVISDGEEKFQLQLPLSSNYFTDFGRKLPNIHITDKVNIAPYDFTPKDGKKKTGLSITQEGIKIENYYYDADKKENLHGFPTPKGKGKGFDSDDWKMYFIEVKKFMKKKVQEVISTMEVNPINTTSQTEVNDDEKEKDDLPF
jgi:hypothetical protein